MRELPRNLVADQVSIWTSPLRLRLDNVQWLAPLLGTTAIVIASDTDIQRKLPTSASFKNRSNNVSNYGAAAFAAFTGGAWLLGHARDNAHMSETAVLSGEAVLDSMAVVYAMKGITRRDRPYEGDQHGNFWSRGNSFPSEHAAGAWSIATVFAHQYPGPLSSVLAYGGAAAVSAARVGAGKHFASDVLVGSALGYFVGRQVYRAHQNRLNPDLAYGTFERDRAAEGPRDPANMGSPYLPLDSWAYAAFDRLAGLGYIKTAFAGLRPWTRMECARLLEEARSVIQSTPGDSNPEAVRLLQSLSAEFAFETSRRNGATNLAAEIESIYTRFTGISGTPLNDSFHFGQTVVNDFGRPYQQGFNSVTGFTSRAVAGPFAFYVRGEYRHAPGAPAYPLNVRTAISDMDIVPVAPATPFASHDDFQLLDTYVALNIRNYQFSFGRQSVWWGPGQEGALMFSNNALPFYMLRLSRTEPAVLPSVFRLLGPMRTDIIFGRLEGHQFPKNPYISAQKLSFKPTPNLEFGFSKMTVFGGGGQLGTPQPLTWSSFYKATFSTGDHLASDSPGLDAGDRRGGFDFSYRIPHLRDWLVVYSDALSEDDPSPLAAPMRSAFNPGIYLVRVPGLPKLDFHAEAAYTNLPGKGSVGGKFIYWNTRFRDSHTNAGDIMGHWIGREGRGLQMWSTYWLSPQSTIRVGYRGGNISADFVPGGGRQDDFYARTELRLTKDVTMSGGIQFERWNFPLLRSSSMSDTSATVQFTYWPRWSIHR